MGVLACLGTLGSVTHADLLRLITESAVHPNRTAASTEQIIQGAMPPTIALKPRQEPGRASAALQVLDASARLDAARQQWSRGFRSRAAVMRSLLAVAAVADCPTPKTNDGD